MRKSIAMIITRAGSGRSRASQSLIALVMFCFGAAGRKRRGASAHAVQYMSQAPAAPEGRPRVLLHRRSPLPRLSAVRPAALSAGRRAVLLRRRSLAVRLRGAALLLLRRAPGCGRERAARARRPTATCKGPHYHWYAPPPQAPFELQGGRLLVHGRLRAGYYAEQPRYVGVNDVYAPLVYDRPVVDVAIAPPTFHGEIRRRRARLARRAVLGAPAVSAGVYVAVPPPPTVSVGIGLGLVAAGRHRAARDDRARARRRAATEAGSRTSAGSHGGRLQRRAARTAARRLARRAGADRRRWLARRSRPSSRGGGGWRRRAGSGARGRRPGGGPAPGHGGGQARTTTRHGALEAYAGGLVARLRCCSRRLRQRRRSGSRLGALGAKPGAGQHVDGTPHTDAVVGAWRSAGLAPEGFAPLQPVPYGASYCEEGRVRASTRSSASTGIRMRWPRARTR